MATKTKTTEDIEVMPQEQPTTKKAAPAKKKFDQNEEILCRSITSGTLVMKGRKTGTLYKWGGYGDMVYVQFGDLQTAKLARLRFVYDPMFIIEDEDLLNQWSDVRDVYDSRVGIDDIKKLIGLSEDQLKAVVGKLSAGAKRNVANLAADAVRSGMLDSVRTIRVLDSILGTELIDLAMGD